MNKHLVVCYPFLWSLCMISGKVPSCRLTAADAHSRCILNDSSIFPVSLNHTARLACTICRKTLTAMLCGMLGMSPLVSAADEVEVEKPTGLTGLSIEQLMNVEVYSASKFAQKTSEAPASVSIVTAADIKNYGYRTLAGILRSVRGMNVSYDRNYDYLGVRGFGRTGDYNSRVLLLVDGYRLNDNVYDQAAIGTEFLLDVDLIDRVEIVRGAGSSIYGSNAILGVINVITKRGRDINGIQASGQLASFGTGKERLSYGRQYENGAELLLSASNYRSAGQDLLFPEFTAANNGIAQKMDGDRYQNLFGKLAYAGFTLTGGYSSRDKTVPTASFGTLFNDPNFVVNDGAAFVDIGYYGKMSERSDISAHLFQGQYRYTGVYPYAPALNMDSARGAWRGAEAKLVGRFEKHKLVIGGEYQDNFRQDQSDFDIAPYSLFLDDKRNSSRAGVYAQDEITLGQGLLLNAGLRYDRYSTVGATFNPRLGLIWSPVDTAAFKFLYGTAFRAPNAFELYYSAGVSQKANPALKPEEIRTYEFVIEHQLRPNFRITADAYSNKISNNINQITDPADGLLVFINSGQVDSHGVEFEAERLWDSGTRLKASYAWQISREKASGAELVNSPKQLAKLNFSMPLFGDAMRSGMEFQYTGSRKTLAGATAGGHLITNLTLLNEKSVKGLELSATIYNLFDRRYSDPAASEHTQQQPPLLPLDMIMQDGRSFRLKASYRF